MSAHLRRPTRAASVLVGLVAISLIAPIRPALARLTDLETVPSTFSTETLDPPTSLAASAALLLRVNLTWTATVDTRATGYLVLRGTANGGPYAQVATVSGTSTVAYQDTVPLPGIYYYVLRTYIGSWTSPTSNQAQVVAT